MATEEAYEAIQRAEDAGTTPAPSEVEKAFYGARRASWREGMISVSGV
jgi:hypothetical protein